MEKVEEKILLFEESFLFAERAQNPTTSNVY